MTSKLASAYEGLDNYRLDRDGDLRIALFNVYTRLLCQGHAEEVRGLGIYLNATTDPMTMESRCALYRVIADVIPLVPEQECCSIIDLIACSAVALMKRAIITLHLVRTVTDDSEPVLTALFESFVSSEPHTFAEAKEYLHVVSEFFSGPYIGDCNHLSSAVTASLLTLIPALTLLENSYDKNFSERAVKNEDLYPQEQITPAEFNEPQVVDERTLDSPAMLALSDYESSEVVACCPPPGVDYPAHTTPTAEEPLAILSPAQSPMEAHDIAYYVPLGLETVPLDSYGLHASDNSSQNGYSLQPVVHHYCYSTDGATYEQHIPHFVQANPGFIMEPYYGQNLHYSLPPNLLMNHQPENFVACAPPPGFEQLEVTEAESPVKYSLEEAYAMCGYYNNTSIHPHKTDDEGAFYEEKHEEELEGENCTETTTETVDKTAEDDQSKEETTEMCISYTTTIEQIDPQQIGDEGASIEEEHVEELERENCTEITTETADKAAEYEQSKEMCISSNSTFEQDSFVSEEELATKGAEEREMAKIEESTAEGSSIELLTTELERRNAVEEGNGEKSEITPEEMKDEESKTGGTHDSHEHVPLPLSVEVSDDEKMKQDENESEPSDATSSSAVKDKSILDKYTVEEKSEETIGSEAHSKEEEIEDGTGDKPAADLPLQRSAIKLATTELEVQTSVEEGSTEKSGINEGKLGSELSRPVESNENQPKLESAVVSKGTNVDEVDELPDLTTEELLLALEKALETETVPFDDLINIFHVPLAVRTRRLMQNADVLNALRRHRPNSLYRLQTHSKDNTERGVLFTSTWIYIIRMAFDVDVIRTIATEDITALLQICATFEDALLCKLKRCVMELMRRDDIKCHLDPEEYKAIARAMYQLKAVNTLGVRNFCKSINKISAVPEIKAHLFTQRTLLRELYEILESSQACFKLRDCHYRNMTLTD